MDDSNNHLSLRKVIKTDEILLFDWINDPDVRKWSFNKNSITLDVHKIWFKQKFDDVNVLMWIFEVNSTPAGLVRLEKDNSEVVLNYMIAFHSRGKGLASKMLKMAMNEIKNYWQNVKLLAYTLPENIASIESLKKAGFSLENSSDEKNCYVFHITESMSTTGE